MQQCVTKSHILHIALWSASGKRHLLWRKRSQSQISVKPAYQTNHMVCPSKLTCCPWLHCAGFAPAQCQDECLINTETDCWKIHQTNSSTFFTHIVSSEHQNFKLVQSGQSTRRLTVLFDLRLTHMKRVGPASMWCHGQPQHNKHCRKMKRRPVLLLLTQSFWWHSSISNSD